MVTSIISNIINEYLPTATAIIITAVFALAAIAFIWQICINKPSANNPPISKNTVIKVLLAALAFRLIFLIMARCFFTSWGAAIDMLQRGDAQPYRNIAENWYIPQEEGKQLNLVFFPLFPLIMRYIFFLIPNYLTCWLITTNGSFIIAALYIFKLVALKTDEKTAWWALAFVSLSPFAFFFGVPMTEATMLMTSAAALYYILKHNWFAAGIWGMFAAFNRLVGVAVALAFAAEFIQFYGWKNAFQWKNFKHALWALLIPFGSFLYLLVNYLVAGNWFEFLIHQREHWFHRTQTIYSTIKEQFSNIDAYGELRPLWKTYIFIPNLIMFAIATFLIAWGAFPRSSRKKEGEEIAAEEQTEETPKTCAMPPALGLYSLAFIGISYSVSWLLSGARYIAPCVPVFAFLPIYVKNKHARCALITIFAASCIYLYWGYLKGKPIY